MTPPFTRLFREVARVQDDHLAHKGIVDLPVRTIPVPRRRWDGRLLLLAGAGVAVLAFASVVALSWRRPLEFRMGAHGQRGTGSAALVADGNNPLPLRFSDGSAIEFLPGAKGRVERLDSEGAHLVLLEGRLDAHVRHADTTRWLFSVGPFQIRVTGTRFSAEWSDVTRELLVKLHEGSVLVTGSGLDPQGVPVRAGQELRLRAVEHSVTPIAEQEAPTTATPVPDEADSVAPPLAGTAPADEWAVLVRRREYGTALRMAEKSGFSSLCRRMAANDLIFLGDAARFAGDLDRAVQAFRAVVERFPTTGAAADAVFSLGRIDFQRKQFVKAAGWFEQYAREWPNAPLSEQASGRLLECRVQIGDVAATRSLATRYLVEYPDGPHAELARRALADDKAP